MIPARTTVPDDVAQELRRVVQRWRQLPLDHALTHVPSVHAVLAELADGPAPAGGPQVVMDQLTVLVQDACREGRSAGVAERLVALRRVLS